MVAETPAPARVASPGRQPSAFPLFPDEALWSRPALDPTTLFVRRAPLEVEIGSGKARFLVEAARETPAHDFLGVERSLSYYRICRERVERARLSNARMIRADGRILVEALPLESVRAFHIYFPDPWPKKKQRKRRLLDGVTLEILAGRLEPGGTLRIATDHSGYGSGLGPILESVPALRRLAWEDLPPPPPTHYDLKYRQEGRAIWKYLLKKR
ncbi:MAG: tRNA (guanosine(46)-N(7))-methyltransferase TrmB [Thermoanaerobaculia bacterium]|nr:tRNA (guanosine(46)-N7)-methyltransferase TrmB [Acidobacteriota bacterium]